jgi:hypothetical protein
MNDLHQRFRQVSKGSKKSHVILSEAPLTLLDEVPMATVSSSHRVSP